MNKHFTDDVSGQIVGGDYCMAWVTYDGRKQRQSVCAKNREDAEKLLENIVNSMKSEYGAVFKDIFPEQKWRFHFDGA